MQGSLPPSFSGVQDSFAASGVPHGGVGFVCGRKCVRWCGVKGKPVFSLVSLPLCSWCAWTKNKKKWTKKWALDVADRPTDLSAERASGCSLNQPLLRHCWHQAPDALTIANTAAADADADVYMHSTNKMGWRSMSVHGMWDQLQTSYTAFRRPETTTAVCCPHGAVILSSVLRSCVREGGWFKQQSLSLSQQQ